MNFAGSFLTSLLDAAARSLLFAAAVGLGLWALRLRNVVAQKAAWMLVLAASLAMPLVAHWAAHLGWLPDRDTFVVSGHAWRSTTHSTTPAPPAFSITTRTYVTRQYDAEPSKQSATDPSAIAPSSGRFPAPAIVHVNPETEAPAPFVAPAASPLARLNPAQTALLVYLAICGALLFRLVYGAWAAARLWRGAEPVELEESALAGGIAVRCSSAIASPVTVGSGIVLPADFASWDAEKLRIVLAHEGSHVRQRDFALQLAASLYIALFWFSPLGWWLKRKLSCLSETISDGAAVNQAASHASYAQVLLEFAALPRPIQIGVAMAHRGHLRSRIEHLLNENNFRQAFSGGRLRLAAAVVLVPVALFAATAMVRVQAAGQQTPPAPATAPAQSAPPAQTAPVNVPPPSAPADATAPAAAPANTPPLAVISDDDQTIVAPPGAEILVAPKAPVSPDGVLMVPVPPGGWARGSSRAWVSGDAKAWANMTRARASMQVQMAKNMAVFNKQNFIRDGFFNDGNSYAYVTGQGDNGIHYSGNWYDGSRDEIDKARKVAHGDFLWFERDGKSYVIDDPSLVASLKPMQDQMDSLGKQQDDLGQQQDALGKQQEELGKQMEQVRVPTPDMKSQLDKLQAVQAKLAAIQGKDVSQQQLAEIQNELGDIQGRIGALQGNMGGRMGELGGKMGELGGQQGKLGAEQGRLGAEQGRIAREMDGKILTIIDESIKDGKARQVQ